MTDIKMINEQIRYLQKILQSEDLTDMERISYTDTLTFLLDTRALLNLQNCKGKEPKEMEN
jgi:hypothetical protein